MIKPLNSHYSIIIIANQRVNIQIYHNLPLMMSINYTRLSKYSRISIIILSMIAGNAASAESLNAGFVLNKMNGDQQVSYIAGVIEGLAYSRYLNDKPSEVGMQCVYDWYAKNTGSARKRKTMTAFFKRHADKPVGVLLHVLIKKQCGA